MISITKEIIVSRIPLTRVAIEAVNNIEPYSRTLMEIG
jgi:hypothetical protein